MDRVGGMVVCPPLALTLNQFPGSLVGYGGGSETGDIDDD
jgi:hypothetical protein